MARRRVLADTTLFIEHLRAQDKEDTRLYKLAEKNQVETCAVVAAEVFYGTRSPDKERQAWSVLRPFPIHPFTIQMAAKQSAVLPDLVQRNKVPDIRDMMIAATAIVLGLPVATLNRSHFEEIPGLELFD